MCVRHAVRHIGADQIAAHNAARKNHGQTRMLGQGVVCHPHKRFAHAEQTVFADIGRVMPVGQWIGETEENIPEGMPYSDYQRMAAVWAEVQSTMGSDVATIGRE